MISTCICLYSQKDAIKYSEVYHCIILTRIGHKCRSQETRTGINVYDIMG